MSFSALYSIVRVYYSNGGSNITRRRPKMYLTALEKQLIPDAETISLNDLPDQGRWPSLNKLNNSLCEANKPYKSSNEANTFKESPSFLQL